MCQSKNECGCGEQINNSQFCCNNCMSEKEKHEETRKALEKAIKLSNFLIEELDKFEQVKE